MSSNSSIWTTNRWSKYSRKPVRKILIMQSLWSLKGFSPWIQTLLIWMKPKESVNSTTLIFLLIAPMILDAWEKEEKGAGNSNNWKTCQMLSWLAQAARPWAQISDSLDAMIQMLSNIWNTTLLLTCSRMPSTQSKLLLLFLTFEFLDHS